MLGVVPPQPPPGVVGISSSSTPAVGPEVILSIERSRIGNHGNFRELDRNLDAFLKNSFSGKPIGEVSQTCVPPQSWGTVGISSSSNSTSRRANSNSCGRRRTGCDSNRLQFPFDPHFRVDRGCAKNTAKKTANYREISDDAGSSLVPREGSDGGGHTAPNALYALFLRLPAHLRSTRP